MTDLGSFESVGPHSGKVRCTLCGQSGYAGGPWQTRCMVRHEPCPGGCGRSFPLGNAMATHVRLAHGTLSLSASTR